MAINTAGQTVVKTISGDNHQYTEGVITFDATAITVTDYVRFETGFKPRKVVVTNLTDRTSLEWSASMPATSWIKTVAAGTVTLDTTAGALIIDDRGVSILQNATLGLILASKVVRVEAWG